MEEEDKVDDTLRFILDIVRLIAMGTLLVIGWNERFDVIKSILRDPKKNNLEKASNIMINLI